MSFDRRTLLLSGLLSGSNFGINQSMRGSFVNIPSIDKATIADGESPIKATDENHANIIREGAKKFEDNLNEHYEDAKAYYELHYELLTSETNSFKDVAFSADANFTYQPNELDKDFNFLHVEELLNQTADILTRAIAEKGVFDEHSTKAANLALELKDFFLNDEVHQREVEAGIYNVAYLSSNSEVEALARQINNLDAVISNLKIVEQTTSDFQIPLIDAASVTALIPYMYMTSKLKFGDREEPIKDFAVWAASTQATAASQDRKFSVVAQILEYEGQQDAARSRLVGASARRNWDYLDIGFKREHTEIARTLARTKVILSCLENGALNHAERREASHKRFSRDVNDALGRFRAVSKGLQLIYGYSVKDPMEDLVRIGAATQQELDATPFLGKIDPFINWIRDAVAWLIRFQGNESSFIKAFSIKSLIGEEGWAQGLASGGKWEFTLSESFFSELRHVRIRSLSAFSVAVQKDSCWDLIIRLPKISSVIHMNGSKHSIDQQMLNAVRFGRVTGRESLRPPELSDAAAVHNAAPFGKWSLQAAASLVNNDKNLKLSDIVIELDIAAIDSS